VLRNLLQGSSEQLRQSISGKTGTN
jgi:hypothetical protein